jgi:hypothetical protein
VVRAVVIEPGEPARRIVGTSDLAFDERPGTFAPGFGFSVGHAFLGSTKHADMGTIVFIHTWEAVKRP